MQQKQKRIWQAGDKQHTKVAVHHITSTGKSCCVRMASRLKFQFWGWGCCCDLDGSLCSLGSALEGWSPFLYSVRGSLSTKSPSSLCLSLWALLCLCWISCPTTKTEPLGKPYFQSWPPPRPPVSQTHTHTHALGLHWWIILLALASLILTHCASYLWCKLFSDIQTLYKTVNEMI